MKVLLMDVGSTFVKYAVCDDSDGEYVLNSKIPFPQPYIDEPFTVRRQEIENAVRLIMAVATDNKCKKVFISVQMHGFLLRYKTGEISDYFSWRSSGGDVKSKAMSAIDFASRGTRLKPNLPIAKLYKERKMLDGAEFFTLGSYIVHFLTGNNTTHKTDACASGFYTVEGTEDNETVPGLLLPKFMDSVEVCGTYCGMKVYTPVGDHAASVYGSGIDGNAYLLNVGTTSQIAFVGRGNAPSDKWECRPYFENESTLFTLGNLFYGLYDNKEKYCAEAAKMLNSLPKRERILIGGGGAERITEMLGSLLETPCDQIGYRIGLDGLLRIAKTKKLRLGTMLSEIPFTNMPIIMKNCGLDFMIVDNEHGAFDYTTLSGLFTVSRLSDFCSIVRLPDNTRAGITKCVDAGADGFLLPMTNTADDVRKVVEYAKYSPIGKRGISTMRAHTLYAPPSIAEYMLEANERVKVYAQIETELGVKNIDSILSVNGVDGVFIGPNDLACDMKCISDNGPIIEAIKIISAAAKKANKPFGIITTSAALLECALKNGAEMISYGSELNMIKNGCEQINRSFR